MRCLIVLLLVSVFFLASCGSGGDSPQSTGTETSQRAERQATVSQQQTQSVPEEQDTSSIAEEQQVEDSEDQQVVELPPELVGEHKGLRSERHVLGDPDAPIEIRYYGDFT
jgi:hypothetical protein